MDSLQEFRDYRRFRQKNKKDYQNLIFFDCDEDLSYCTVT